MEVLVRKINFLFTGTTPEIDIEQLQKLQKNSIAQMADHKVDFCCCRSATATATLHSEQQIAKSCSVCAHASRHSGQCLPYENVPCEAYELIVSFRSTFQFSGFYRNPSISSVSRALFPQLSAEP